MRHRPRANPTADQIQQADLAYIILSATEWLTLLIVVVTVALVAAAAIRLARRRSSLRGFTPAEGGPMSSAVRFLRPLRSLRLLS